MKEIQAELSRIAKLLQSADGFDTKKIKKSLGEIEMFSKNANSYLKQLEKSKKGDYSKVADLAYEIYDAMDIILASANVAFKEAKRLEKEGEKRNF